MEYGFSISGLVYITEYSYINSIKNLPFFTIKSKDNVSGFNFSIQLDIKDINNDIEIINEKPKSTYTLTKKSFNDIYQYDLVYGIFLRYPNSTKTTTQCKLSLLGIFNYLLTIYPCFTTFFNGHNIPNVGQVFSYDVGNTSIIDFLNYLENFGYYWFIVNHNFESYLRVNQYNNPIYWDSDRKLIFGYSDFSYEDNFPEYKQIQLIKEPNTDSLKRRYVLDNANPCIITDTPFKDFNVISRNPANVYVLAFTDDGKIYGEYNSFGSAVQLSGCISQSVNDCNGKYTFTFRGSSNCSAPCQTATICGRQDLETGEVVDCNGPIYATYDDCKTQIKLVYPCSAGLPLNTRVEIEITDFCNVDNNCIITNTTDRQFNESLVKETITISNYPISCNQAPYVISISNINSVLWNMFKAYYQTISKTKRVVKISNPITNTILKTGYFYDILLPDNTILSDFLLESMNIDSSGRIDLSLIKYV
jgi:hypothetical protein